MDKSAKIKALGRYIEAIVLQGFTGKIELNFTTGQIRKVIKTESVVLGSGTEEK